MLWRVLNSSTMKGIKFLKLKSLHLNDAITFTAIPSLDDIVEWTRMNYARDLYWIKTIPNFEEVSECPSFDLYENDDEHNEKYWNYYLTKINRKYKQGELLDSEIESNGVDVILVVKTDCGRVLLEVSETDIEFDGNTYEDVSDEYNKKLYNLINPKEIEEFVETHNADEVQERYGDGKYGEEMWVL